MPQVNTIESNRMTMPEPQTPNRLWTVPNVLTVSRLLLTPVFLLLIFAANWYFKILALLVFTVASLTDFYDGRIARRNGTVTNFGRFMDPLADKLLVSSALIAFVRLGMVEAWLIGAMLVRDVVITGLRIFAIRRGKPLVTSQLAKWKTMLQLILVFGILVFINVRVVEAELAAQPIVLVGDISYWVLNVLVAVVTFVAVVSGVRYLIENRKTF